MGPWIGVALGVALGPVSCYFGASQLRFDLVSALIAAVATAKFGTLGGMLAATGEQLWRRASRGQSQLVVIGIGLVFAFVAISLLLALARMLFSKQLNVFQLALSILIGVPILCGLVAWLRYDGKRKRGGMRKKFGNRYTSG